MYPSLQQFMRWASQYNALPVWIEPELPSADILEWVHGLLGGTDSFFFLHSASPGPQACLSDRQARYSYWGLERPRVVLRVEGGELTARYQAESGARFEALKVGNPFDRFHGWMSAWRAPRVDGLPPFWGGGVGYIGYECARYMDPRLACFFDRENRRHHEPPADKFPVLEFGIYDAVAAVDHIRRRLWLVETVMLPQGKTPSPSQLERMYRSAQDRLRRQAVHMQRALRRRRPWSRFEASAIRSNQSEAAYRLMVRRAKGHIAAGDIYQSNLCQIFSAPYEGDPWWLYRCLTRINPSPYAALWRSGQRWMLSASPELLLRREADHVETRPIAGTYPRGQTPEADRQVRAALPADPKERAEHIMLVDLERNDLGRVCRASSIQIAEALSIEAYSHVFHLVSDIRGLLNPGKTWRDLIRACFPGGTITGCPKIRCMELIHQLEPESRGPYTGSLGWIGFNGDLTLNILIRTFFLNHGTLCFPVGAGIVADSDPGREYQETLQKAQALMLALQGSRAPAAGRASTEER